MIAICATFENEFIKAICCRNQREFKINNWKVRSSSIRIGWTQTKPQPIARETKDSIAKCTNFENEKRISNEVINQLRQEFERLSLEKKQQIENESSSAQQLHTKLNDLIAKFFENEFWKWKNN